MLEAQLSSQVFILFTIAVKLLSIPYNDSETLNTSSLVELLVLHIGFEIFNDRTGTLMPLVRCEI